MPGQDHGPGGEPNFLGARCEIREVHEVVRTEGVIFKVVLDDPDVIKTLGLCEKSEFEFLFVDTRIAQALVAETLHHHHHSDFHRMHLPGG